MPETAVVPVEEIPLLPVVQRKSEGEQPVFPLKAQEGVLRTPGGFRRIVGEKEAGTIEQINVSPVPRRLFILAKLMPNWAIGLVALAFGMTFAWAVHGITPAAGVATVLLPSAIFILAASAMGMVISNYSETMQQAMFVMFFFIIIMMLTCGLFTPVESMPRWAQAVTAANPMTYFTKAMRMAYLKGSSPADMAPCLAALTAFAAALNAWAVASYRKSC